jgi:hypothetical protein
VDALARWQATPAWSTPQRRSLRRRHAASVAASEAESRANDHHSADYREDVGPTPAAVSERDTYKDQEGARHGEQE